MRLARPAEIVTVNAAVPARNRGAGDTPAKLLEIGQSALRIGLERQNREFLSPDAAHPPDVAQGLGEQVRHHAQHLVADQVAVRVVHLLEAVHVDDDEGHEGRVLIAVEKCPPVQQAGERICPARVMQRQIGLPDRPRYGDGDEDNHADRDRPGSKGRIPACEEHQLIDDVARQCERDAQRRRPEHEPEEVAVGADLDFPRSQDARQRRRLLKPRTLQLGT